MTEQYLCPIHGKQRIVEVGETAETKVRPVSCDILYLACGCAALRDKTGGQR